MYIDHLHGKGIARNFLAHFLVLGASQMIKVEVKSVCEQTVCLHFELQYFLRDNRLSESPTLFGFATRLNESFETCERALKALTLL